MRRTTPQDEEIDSLKKMSENVLMSTIDVAAKQDLQESIRRLANGVRDPEIMRSACARMDRMREELRERIGTIEEAVELIRDASGP
jgi:hypothetical protein